MELEDIEEQIKQLNNIEAEPSEDHINIDISNAIDNNNFEAKENVKIESCNKSNDSENLEMKQSNQE